MNINLDQTKLGSDTDYIKVDIAVENNEARSAMRTTIYVQNAVKCYPPLNFLVTLIKYLLCLKGLNKPYNGGLSSYAITLLVMAWLENNNYKKRNMAELFLNLIYFYGYKFDSKIQGIHFYFNNKFDQDQKYCPFFDLTMYSLIDRGMIFIADPTLPPFKNVSPNAFQFNEIQCQFRLLYDKLSEIKTQFLIFSVKSENKEVYDEDLDLIVKEIYEKNNNSKGLMKKLFMDE